MLWSNVKFLFDHVTRRYDKASLGTASERQDRQADSVVHVHTSHELVQSSVHTSKHEWFTFIVHHLNSELVHSSVHFHFFFLIIANFSGGHHLHRKVRFLCKNPAHNNKVDRMYSLSLLSLAIFILRPRAVALEYVACLV